MSLPTESSTTTVPTPDSQPTNPPGSRPDPLGNGSPPPSESTATVGKTRKLPSQGRGARWFAPAAIGGAVLIGALGVAGWWFFLRPAPVRADVLLHTVKREPLIVSVTEKGTLESADNRDIICKVRAGTKGFASSINWVIDDGTRVKPGELLMLLDDSALKDQEDAQQITLDSALNDKIRAEKDYDIAVKANEISVAAARNVLANAEIDLDKLTGLDYDPALTALAALGGGIASLSESGTYRQTLDDLTGKVRQAESDLEQYRERAAWADRMAKLTYMTAAQAQAEKSKLDSAVESLRSAQAARSQHINYNRKQLLTDLTSKRDKAALDLEKALLDADALLAKAQAEKQRATSAYLQQDDKLRDIRQQRTECRITAPENIEPDSMVVYFKPDSNRFSNTTTGMIEQGAQVKEGQKMLRIPNLHRMQVNTKVHEAMVARIRGDVRVPTFLSESVQKVMMLDTDPFTRLVGQRQEMVERIRDRFRAREYKTTSPGQRATIRVDALPERVFSGHVRTVAAVASQADAWISDVKLYQTLVLIDSESLPDGTQKKITSEEIKPDMTAEVTITVDTAKDPVLTVPVQAVIGGTEMGAKREIFVKTPTGYERRPVTLGLYNEKAVEIREGLTEGDEIVLNPKVLLAPDDKTRTRDDGSKNGSKGGNGKGGDAKGGDGDSPKGAGGGKGKKGGGGGGPPPGP